MIETIEDLKNFILKILDDKKAEEINVIDLRQKSSIAQYMVFATGRSTKNVAAIADFLAYELKQKTNLKKINLDGMRESEWVVIDAGDIIVHVFHPEARAAIRLEDMWNKK